MSERESPSAAPAGVVGGTRRALAANLLSLSVLQYASYFFPLITIPYLTRVIGVEKFGLVAFAQAAVAYVSVLVSYGFSYSATRTVALGREDRSRVQQVFSDVLWTKVLLAGLGGVGLVAVAVASPAHRREYLLFLAAYAIVLGSVASNEWFFQGMQDMRFVTVAGLTSRGVTTALVFVLVRGPSDYALVPLLNGAGAIAGGVLGMWIIYRRYGIAIGRFRLRGVTQQLREGWDTFLSTAFVSLYTTSNVFILGLISSPAQVGFYSAGEKVIAAVKSLWVPVPQTLYPHFSKAFSTDKRAAGRQFRRVLGFTALLTGAMAVASAVAAPVIVQRYLGPTFAQTTPIIQVLSLTVFAVGVSNVLGVQGLLANGMTGPFRNIVGISALANVALLPLCVLALGTVGAAYSVSFVELVIAAMMWGVLRKRSLV